METHFRHKRTTASNSFGVVVSTVAQHSFKVLGGVRIPPALLTEQLKTKQLKTYLGSEVLLAACLALNQIGEGSNPSGPTIEMRKSERGNRNERRSSHGN